MQCREFREVSESYLSDELLVETNHQINHHLEHCPECRADFASRQALRKRVNSAGKNAANFQINPIFNNKLEFGLKEEAMRSGFWTKFWLTPKVLLPALAVLVLAFGFGIVYLSNRMPNTLVTSNSLAKGLAELAHFAAGNHKDCALEKLGMWEKMSKSDYPEKAAYSQKILAPLKAKYSDNVEMLSVHDCEYQGKQFTHVVLRSGSNIVSVFFDKSDSLSEPKDSQISPITSEVENGLQVASFANHTQAIFVVSDLPETENLNVARTISYSLSQSS
ncbi:MAG: zf-HC2 domain-containing protein [Pyrinomonadaceae bacterium]